MAVALDAVGTGSDQNQTNSGNSVEISNFDVDSGVGDNVIVVGGNTFIGSGSLTPTATFHKGATPTAMTQTGTIAISGGDRTTQFIMVAPDTGGSGTDCVVSVGGGAHELAFAIAAYTGVDQTTPNDAAVTETVTTDPVDMDVTSETDDMVVDVISSFNGTGLFAPTETGQIERQEYDGGGGFSSMAIGDRPGQTTTTMGWDIGSITASGHVAINLNASSGGAPVTLAASMTVLGTFTAGLSVARAMTSSMTVLSTMTAALSVTRPLAASMTATSDMTAALTVSRALAASMTSTSDFTAALTVSRALAANMTVLGTFTAALDVAVGGQVELASSMLSTADLTAAMVVARALAASMSATSDMTANLIVARALAANMLATCDMTAALTIPSGLVAPTTWTIPRAPRSWTVPKAETTWTIK